MISDTSALVLLWANGEIHTSKNSKDYLKSLDLRHGKKLLTKCNKIADNYDQVIKNRKKCVLDLVESEIKQRGITQIIIFGAGWDALSVELASRINNLKIYELDAANMDKKRELLKGIDESLADSIYCINVNLQNSLQAYNKLKSKGWNALKPSILIFEGISYYLSQAQLASLVRKFKLNCQNVLVLEYLKNNNQKNVAGKIFDTIKESTGSKITKYQTDSLKSYLENIGGIVIKNYSLPQMEENRLGYTVYFRHRDWINVCCCLV